jgi:hypothetical protein
MTEDRVGAGVLVTDASPHPWTVKGRGRSARSANHWSGSHPAATKSGEFAGTGRGTAFAPSRRLVTRRGDHPLCVPGGLDLRVRTHVP